MKLTVMKPIVMKLSVAKRIVPVLVACALLVGCPTKSGPPSGVWDSTGLSLPAGLPLDPTAIDPNAQFILFNLGRGQLVLDQLSDQIPVAIQNELIANLEEILALQDVLGTVDVASLIGELEGIRDLLLMGLGNFIPGFVLQPILDFFGVATLDELVNALIDMISQALLLNGFVIDEQQLLAELAALPGAFSEALTCSLANGDFTCEQQVREFDLRPLLDAVILLTVDVSGTFSGNTDVAADITVDAACTGTECTDLLLFSGIDFPFTVQLSGSAPGA